MSRNGIKLILLVFIDYYATQAIAEVDITDAKDRYSYSLGYSLGKQLTRTQKGFDKSSFLQGIDDGREQITPLIDEQEMMAITGQNSLKVLGFQGAKKHATLVSRRELNQNRRLTGSAFLKENSKREGVVTLASGLQYRVLVEGEGPIPHLHSQVSIQYKVRTLDGGNIGKALDTEEVVTRPVSGLIKGLSEAVQHMPVGSTWRLFIPPELAYGRRSKLAYQTVVMDLELIAVN